MSDTSKTAKIMKR